MYKAKQFIEAIKGSGGIISEIARRVGCDWHTAKIWIDNKPTVGQAYHDECEAVNDLATGVIVKAIKSNDIGNSKLFISLKRVYEFEESHDLQIEYVNDWRNTSD